MTGDSLKRPMCPSCEELRDADELHDHAGEVICNACGSAVGDGHALDAQGYVTPGGPHPGFLEGGDRISVEFRDRQNQRTTRTGTVLKTSTLRREGALVEVDFGEETLLVDLDDDGNGGVQGHGRVENWSVER